MVAASRVMTPTNASARARCTTARPVTRSLLRVTLCIALLGRCGAALLNQLPPGVSRRGGVAARGSGHQLCAQRRRLHLVRSCVAEDGPEEIVAFGFGDTDEVRKGSEEGASTTTIEKPGGLEDSDFSVSTILKQLESIQQGTPKNIVVLGTRHCSFLHQQIIELLSYALVLSDNHIYTSGATGTHAAAIRGALRAEQQNLLTVILPQTVQKQPREIRELLGQVRGAGAGGGRAGGVGWWGARPPARGARCEMRPLSLRLLASQVTQVIELGHNQLPLDAASRICNSELLSKGDQLIVFAFHDSKTLRETIEEAKAMSLLVTVLFLD